MAIQSNVSLEIMASLAAYQDLNPFISTSIGETDLWKNGSWTDVPGIHAAQFDSLTDAVKAARRYKRTQVRFVRGAGGSGKSHLFTRLRRELADTIFYAYAANPPRQPEALESFFLNRLVGSLRNPARAKDGSAMPYSQLRHLAYALLRPVVEQEVTLDQLHEAWSQIPLPEQKDMTHQALLLLEEEHPLVPRSILRCILSTLRTDKEHLAAQWLSGATYLTESDLKYLGVPESLNREDAGSVIHLLGKLAAQAGLPFVLVMDQLDLFAKPEELDEFQRLLFGLIDQSTNWVVFIGLISDRFVTWDSALTQALRGRIGVSDIRAPLGFRLPVIDVLPIGPADKRLLLEKRLDSPELVAQREKDGIKSALHPMTEEDLSSLVDGGAIFPRHLLAGASQRYDERASGSLIDAPPTPPAKLETPKPKVESLAPPSKLDAKREAEPVAETKPKPTPESPFLVPSKVPEPPSGGKAVAPMTEKSAPAASTPPLAPVSANSETNASTPAKPKPPAPAPATPAIVAAAGAGAITAAAVTKATPELSKPESTPAPSPQPKAKANPLSPPSAVPVAADSAKQVKTPLKEKLTELLAHAIGAAKSTDATPTVIELGERVRDLVDVMAESKVVHRPGDLRESYSGFDGSDQVFTWGGTTLRVIATDAMRNSFIATLERLQAQKGPLLLLRHAVAAISGVRTVELVNDIKRRHQFHHVPASEADVLAGLGSVLASLREGSYETLATDPPATAENVRAALRELPVIQNLKLWEVIRQAREVKSSTPPPPPPKPIDQKPRSMLATLAERTAKVATPSKSTLPPPTFVAIPDGDPSVAGSEDIPTATPAEKFPPAPTARRVSEPEVKQVTPPPIPVARRMPPPLPPKSAK